MRKRPKAVRALALLLALWLAFPGSATAKTIEEVQAEQERLAAEHQELEARTRPWNTSRPYNRKST